MTELRYIYVVSPWDYDFPLVRHGLDDDDFDHESLLTKAKELLVKKTDWEGDVNQEGVGVLPSDQEGSPYYYVIVKQQNNGTTYIVSEIPLPWLKDCSVMYTETLQEFLNP